MPNVPNYQGKFLEGSNVPGEIKEPGLPNITGRINNNTKFGPSGLHNPTVSGAFSPSSWNHGFPVWNSHISSAENGYGDSRPIYFDASYCNPIYGNSETVQPPSVTVKYLIKAE